MGGAHAWNVRIVGDACVHLGIHVSGVRLPGKHALLGAQRTPRLGSLSAHVSLAFLFQLIIPFFSVHIGGGGIFTIEVFL